MYAIGSYFGQSSTVRWISLFTCWEFVNGLSRDEPFSRMLNISGLANPGYCALGSSAQTGSPEDRRDLASLTISDPMFSLLNPNWLLL